MILASLFATFALAAPAAQNFVNINDAPFDRMFIVVLENRDYDVVMKNPYMGKVLTQKGRLLTNYKATTHPSQPNYVAMTAGNTKNVILDFKAKLTQRNVVDVLEERGISWKTYQENYPGNCFTGEDADNKLYVSKHNPFISYTNINSNPARCAKIVNSNELAKDIANNAVPQYVFYTPNMNNDGHDTDVRYASNWLQGFIEPLLADPLFANTLFVVTFDESGNILDFIGNKVYTLLIGGPAAPGTTDDSPYNHYSLLATLSTYFGTADLDNSNKARPFIFN
ncbi:phosphoesterase family-domain-containing protein [Gorgonomyces haynaldii]|nr:phosphoesterase family-domain-containing protein [Gorgonomyces haynaldii]